MLGLAVDGENERKCRAWASRTRKRDTHGGQSRVPGESLEDRRLLLSKEERGRKHQAQRRLRRSALVARRDRERAVVWEESSQSERRKDHTFQGCTCSWSCTRSISSCSTKPGSCRQVGAVTLEGRGGLAAPASTRRPLQACSPADRYLHATAEIQPLSVALQRLGGAFLSAVRAQSGRYQVLDLYSRGAKPRLVLRSIQNILVHPSREPDFRPSSSLLNI